MKILVDMDDVLEKLVKAWVECLNEKYSTQVRPEDISEWDIHVFFPQLTEEQVYEIPDTEGFWKRVQPIEGAAEALQSLIADGHEVYIATATMYQSMKDKMEYVLFKYFPFIKWDQVIVTSKKQMIKGDILIDDGPHNLEGGDYYKILFTAAHNRKFDEKSIGAVRVNNWKEALEEVRRFSLQHQE